jgi:dienelactone hydrolase
LHSGQPKGSEQTIGGLPTYVAASKDGSKDKTVVFVTDIFGYKLNNVRILADEYAQQGFRVLIPDLFDGDYVDDGLLKAIAPQQSDPEPSLVQKGVDGAKVAASLGPWVAKHREG